MESLKVAVIGGGVAGLISAHELLKAGHQVILFEKSNKLGGLWVYDPRVESDSLSHELVHSSVYDSLRTNLPRPLMGFSDFAFEDQHYGDPRVFPGHQEVLAFLNDFATRFGITELTRFNSEVVRVERVGVDQWVVEWRRVDEELRVIKSVTFKEEFFDAVVVCNGHCTVPHLAKVPGIERWPGKQIHSHNYRLPEPFTDQVVVIIGNGASSYDISLDIANVAKEVHLSSRSTNVKFSKLDHRCNMWQHSAHCSRLNHLEMAVDLRTEACSRKHQVPIYTAKEDGTIEFEDGSSVKAHILLHCTGYNYEFPFLNTNGIVSVDDKRVGPLYKHVFPPKLAPSLSFVGLPNKVIIFEMMELQSKWIARVLAKKVGLPSEEEMMADVHEYYQQMTLLGRPKHLTHYLINFDEYLDWLALQAGTSSLDCRKEMYKETVKHLENRKDGYRDDPNLLMRIHNLSTTMGMKKS